MKILTIAVPPFPRRTPTGRETPFSRPLSALILILFCLTSPTFFSPAALAEEASLVPYSEFAGWPIAKKKAYLDEIKQVWYAFETVPLGTFDLGENDERESLLDQLLRSRRGVGFMFNSVATAATEVMIVGGGRALSQAVADAAQGFCFVGGVRRKTVPNPEPSGRPLCPTWGRGCGQLGAAGFLCGAVWDNACVPRQPSENLSDRCRSGSRGEIPSEKLYAQKKSDFELIHRECQSDAFAEPYRSQCAPFIERLRVVATKYSSRAERATNSLPETAPAPPPAVVDEPSAERAKSPPIPAASPTTPPSIAPATTSPPRARPISSLSHIAYVGDSQTGAPGVPMIGDGLASCLDRKKIIGFGNATPSSFLGGRNCRLMGSFQGDGGDLCQIASAKFKSILSEDNRKVDTVVVALGDNPSLPNFERMLNSIVNAGKKCVWVAPARKNGNNTNTDLARTQLRSIAESLCGADGIIDPSSDGSRFETRSSDHVHYTAEASRKIARRICGALKKLEAEGTKAAAPGREEGTASNAPDPLLSPPSPSFPPKNSRQSTPLAERRPQHSERERAEKNSQTPAIRETDDAACKAVYGLLVEGTIASPGVVESDFHENVAAWANAYAQVSAGVSIIPPNQRLKRISGEGGPSDAREIGELEDAVKNGTQCSPAITRKVISEINKASMPDRTAKPSSNLMDYKLAGRAIAGLPNVKVENTDVRRARPLDNTLILRQIKNLKSRCGRKADQVVMISVKDHGAKSCQIMLDQDHGLTPSAIRQKLIQPFLNEDVRVVINFDACYSGCFMNALRDLPSNVCLNSTTSRDRMSMGGASDTYDTTYPDYLMKLKNPLKAHICASAHDPYNTPQVGAGGLATSRQSRPPSGTAADLKSLSRSFGFENLANECASVDVAASRSETPKMSSKDFVKIEECPAIQNALYKMVGVEETKIMLEARRGNPSAAGLRALAAMTAQPNEIRAARAACDIDLNEYMKPNLNKLARDSRTESHR